MNDAGILLLSTIMELIFVFSVVIAAVVLWINARAKGAPASRDASESRQAPGAASRGETRKQ